MKYSHKHTVLIKYRNERMKSKHKQYTHQLG